MRPNLFGKRQIRRHQERGPVDSVETNDFLPYHVQIRGPQSAFIEFRTAHCAQVSDQRVKPHIKYMRRFARHWNSPANRRARDGKILQSAMDKTQNFISSALGTNEIRIRGVKIEQLLLKLGKFEKIIFFGDRFRRASAIGTGITGAGVHNIGIVVYAILPGVMPFLDVSVFAAALEEPLHGAVMLFIRRANKFIAGNT